MHSTERLQKRRGGKAVFFGNGFQMGKDMKVISSVIIHHKENKPLLFYGNGMVRISLCDVGILRTKTIRLPKKVRNVQGTLKVP